MLRAVALVALMALTACSLSNAGTSVLPATMGADRTAQDTASAIGMQAIPIGMAAIPIGMQAIPIGMAAIPIGMQAIPIGTVTNLLGVCSLGLLRTLLGASCTAIRNTVIAPVLDAPITGIPGYHPTDLQRAYNLPSSSAGSGQTIGIVVAYDDPQAESDLAVYRAKFGLPPCTTANGCFRKIGQSGTLPAGDQNWGQEISLDLDVASAVCPHCALVLAEANSADLTDLYTGIDVAIAHGATVVSNSYTAAESANAAALNSRLNHPGVPIVAGTGDNGAGVGLPAAAPSVTAVGGTTLARALGGQFYEAAWSKAGHGCSRYIAKPAWQGVANCSSRSNADVAAVADPNTGVSVYDTYMPSGSKGWLVFGGTSVATPIIAGVYALAGNGRAVNNASGLYSHSASLNHVGGSYSPPTGLGSPNGTGAF